MTFSMMRKAVSLFNHADAPKSTRRHMQRQWLRSMEFLGDRHILANHVGRVTTRDTFILRNY